MSVVDERIVAMRFDNAQFEKGVRTSMRTLEDLKAASNLDDVAGNLSDFSKNFNKTLNFDGTTKDAGIFSKALTGLGKVAKKTFNASTFPLQALGRSLKSLGSYTRAMLGIDLASSLVNTGKTVLRAFTIDPLRSGWSEYELKMDSIKTIMTGTVDTYKKMMEKKNPGFLYDEEKHLEYVKQGLEELNTYADKTIYSFQDMTSNIGKFTNAGVDFETAVDAIKGISNAAAHAGQGSSQASSAMYNLSQALGMGYLGMMDWRSIENANMATLTFKQTLIDLGTAMGKLKKAEDGLTYFVDENGTIDKNTQVTAENLRETLQKKWVDKEVLLAALSVYSGEYSAEEIKQLYHIMDDDVAKALADIGKEASKAATQVRTFTKMWYALKEAAQSGWATTWELIFGDMNEATDFWTSLNDRFSGILDGMADRRNDLLKRWRGQGRYWNYSTGEWYWKQVPDAKDGRKILLDGLNDLLDVLQNIGGAIGAAWEKVFGVLTAEKLVALTEKFGGFTAKMKAWLGDANKDGTRLNKITKGFQGLFSILKGGGTLIKDAITTVANTLHLDKLIDLGLNAFSGIGEWLTGVAGSIETVWNKIGQTEIAQKLSGFFSELWDSVSKFFGEVNPDTGKTGFAEWLESTTTKITGIWDKFTKSDFYQNVSGFFSDMFDSMIGFFQPKNRYDSRGFLLNDNRSPFQETIDSILTWFDGAWKTINSKWTEFTNSDFYKNASGLFSDLWASVIGFFQPKNRYDSRGFLLNDNRSPFRELIDNVGDSWNEFKKTDFYINASSIFNQLKESIGNFFSEKNEKTENAGFTDWFDSTLKKLADSWDEVKSRDLFSGAGEILSSLTDTLSRWLIPSANAEEIDTGKSVSEVWNENKATLDTVAEEVDEKIEAITKSTEKFNTGEVEDGGIIKWFTGLANGISNAWNSVSSSIASIAEDIGKVSDSVTGAVTQFIDWASTVNWDEVLTNAEGHLWSLSGIFGAFTLGRGISGIGSFARNGGKLIGGLGELSKIFGESASTFGKDAGKALTDLGQNLGTGVKDLVNNLDTTRKMDAAGNMVLKFSGALLILTGAFYAITEIVKATPQDVITTALEIFGEFSTMMGLVMGASYMGGASSSKLGTSVLAFAAGIYILLKAVNSIANMSNEGVNFDSALLVLVDLTALVGAFEAFSTLKLDWFGTSWNFGANKKTGLIGFVIAIEGLILAVKQLASLTKDDPHALDNAEWQLTKLTALVVAFEGISTLKIGKIALGAGKATGLIGFAIAIKSMIGAVRELSDLPVDKSEQGTKILAELVGMINAFQVFKGLGNFLGTYNGGKNTSGVIGLIISVEGMILAVSQLGNMDSEKATNGIAMLQQITNMLAIFNVSKGFGDLLSNAFEGASAGLKALSILSLAAYVSSIGVILQGLSHLAEVDVSVEKMQSLTNIFTQLAAVISGSGIALGVMTAIMASIGPAGALKAVEGFGILFGSTGLIAALMAGLDWVAEQFLGKEELDAIPNRIERFGEVYVAYANVLGDILGALIGNPLESIAEHKEKGKLKGLAEGLKELSAVTGDLSEDDMSHLKVIMTGLNVIADNIPRDPSVFKRLFGDEQSISDFARNIANLGSGLSSLSTSISEIENFSEVESGISAISSLLHAAWMLEALNKFAGNGIDAVGNFFDFLWGISTNISGYSVQDNDVLDKLGGFRTFAEDLNAGISYSAEEIDMSPLIDSILTQLEAGKEQVREVLRQFFSYDELTSDKESKSGNKRSINGFIRTASAGLNDVIYDASNLDDMPMLSLQNGTLVLSGTVTLDDSSISGITSAINNQGNAIRGAINGLSSKMDSVASAIRNMKLVLNTGVIAGAVDSVMGKNAVLYSRTGISGGQGSANYSNALANGR